MGLSVSRGTCGRDSEKGAAVMRPVSVHDNSKHAVAESGYAFFVAGTTSDNASGSMLMRAGSRPSNSPSAST